MLKNKVIIVFGGCGLIGREVVKDIRKIMQFVLMQI